MSGNLKKPSFARVITRYVILVYVAMLYMNYLRFGDRAFSASFAFMLVYSCVDKYGYWSGLFESAVNDPAPLRRKRVCEKDLPYMTSECKKAIRNKRKYAVKSHKREF